MRYLKIRHKQENTLNFVTSSETDIALISAVTRAVASTDAAVTRAVANIDAAVTCAVANIDAAVTCAVAKTEADVTIISQGYS